MRKYKLICKHYIVIFMFSTYRKGLGMLDIKCLSMFYINKSFVHFHSAINVYETLCNPQTISITYIFREGPTLL